MACGKCSRVSPTAKGNKHPAEHLHRTPHRQLQPPFILTEKIFEPAKGKSRNSLIPEHDLRWSSSCGSFMLARQATSL